MSQSSETPTPTEEFSFSNHAPLPLTADSAITRSEEDLFGRRNFAGALARAIRSQRGQESFVIALMGLWGCGKTSIKNMALEALRERPESCPLIVEFEPWLWADVPTLSGAFFEAISHVLPRPEAEENAEKREAARRRLTSWKRYQKLFSAGGLLAKGLAPLATLAAADPLLATTLLGAAQGAEESAKSAQVVVEALEAGGVGEGSTDPTTLRRDLREAMASLERPVLVVLDDIERLLGAEEVATVFRLVKANGNFPNLVYLLLFQRESVERSLDELTNGRGRSFLEKIVQAGFDVPALDQETLRQLLTKSTFDAFESHDDKDVSRFQGIWNKGVLPFMRTLRDVRTFLNGLKFTLAAVRDDATGVLPVNAADLVALEVLRTFEPDVYALLPSHKSTLTRWRSIHSRFHRDDAFETLQKETAASLLEAASPSAREPVRTLLEAVFPALRWTWTGNNFYDTPAGRSEVRQRLACHPALFDRYFQLSLAANVLSIAQEQQLIEQTGNREALAQLLRDLEKQGLLYEALEHLSTFADEIPRTSDVAFLTALCDVGDTFPLHPSTTWTARGLEGVAFHTIRFFFQRGQDFHEYKSEQEKIFAGMFDLTLWRSMRLTAFRQAIEQTNGFFFPVYVVHCETALEKRFQEEGGNDDNAQHLQEDLEAKRIFNPNELRRLHRVCVPLLKRAAEDGRLLGHKEAAMMWHCWREWDKSGAPQEWLAQILAPEQSIFLLLRVAQGLTNEQEDEQLLLEQASEFNINHAIAFVPLEELEERVDSVRALELNDQEKLLLDRWDEALRNYKQHNERLKSRSPVEPDQDDVVQPQETKDDEENAEAPPTEDQPSPSTPDAGVD